MGVSTVAASRVVWYMARNPGVAQHLMGCNMVLILFQGLAKPDLSDPLPLIGALHAPPASPMPVDCMLACLSK